MLTSRARARISYLSSWWYTERIPSCLAATRTTRVIRTIFVVFVFVFVNVFARFRRIRRHWRTRTGRVPAVRRDGEKISEGPSHVLGPYLIRYIPH